MTARGGGDQWEDMLAKTKATATAASKRTQPAATKAPARRTVRFQSCDWYVKAARSVGISDNRNLKRSEENFQA